MNSNELSHLIIQNVVRKISTHLLK